MYYNCSCYCTNTQKYIAKEAKCGLNNAECMCNTLGC